MQMSTQCSSFVQKIIHSTEKLTEEKKIDKKESFVMNMSDDEDCADRRKGGLYIFNTFDIKKTKTKITNE